MKIFVSHALKDHELIKGVKKTLEPLGITLYIAEHYVDLERTVTEKIENMIKTSNVALILLTENGFNSNFVRQEIGYINCLKMPCLQLVQVGIEKKLTGFIFGKDYILYDPIQPQIALDRMRDTLLFYWNQLYQEQQANQHKIQLMQFENNKIEYERRANEAKIVIGIFTGVLILGLLATSK